MRADFLSRKDVRKINGLLKEQFGAELDMDMHFFFKNSKDDIFMISRSIEKVDISKINEVSAGLYIGQITAGGIRLSIEGSQILGPKAEKGILDLNEREWRLWLSKNDIEKEELSQMGAGYYIVRNGNDYFGCGYVKDGKLSSYIPKSRAVSDPH